MNCTIFIVQAKVVTCGHSSPVPIWALMNCQRADVPRGRPRVVSVTEVDVLGRLAGETGLQRTTPPPIPWYQHFLYTEQRSPTTAGIRWQTSGLQRIGQSR